MQRDEISFLSTSGHGWTEDMALLKNGLCLDRDYTFRYLVTKPKQKYDIAKAGWKLVRNQFCQKASNIVCADNSLPANIRRLCPNGKKILLAAPYDIYFKNYISFENGEMKKNGFPMDEFTHIVAGSPFMEDLLKNLYGISNEKILKHTALPLSWGLKERYGKEDTKKWLNAYFPQTTGKKLLMVLLSGKQKRKINPKMFSRLIDYMGEGWRVITNHEKLREYDSRILCTGNIKIGSGFLSCCDRLISNDSYYLSVFAATGRPGYCLGFSDCYFEKYMLEHFCALYMEEIEEAAECLKENDIQTEAQKKFVETFSYQSPINPCAGIDYVLQNG